MPEDITVDWPWAFGNIAGFGTCAFQVPPDTRFEDVHELTITRLLIGQTNPTNGAYNWLPWVPYVLGPKGLVDQDEVLRIYPPNVQLVARANVEAEKAFKRQWGLTKIIEATGQLPPHLKNGDLRLQP